MTTEEAYLVGYWFGDGSSCWARSKNRPEGVACELFGVTADRALVERNLELAGYRRNFGAINSPKELVWRVYLGSKWTELLRSLGVSLPLSSRNKVLPTTCFAWSEDLRWSLWAGLLDSDGCLQRFEGPNGLERLRCRYDTVSADLAETVSRLLSSLGLRHSKRVYGNGKWVVDLRSESIKVMIPKMLKISHKANR